MTGATSGTGTADPSGTLEFTPCFYWCLCCSIFTTGATSGIGTADPSGTLEFIHIFSGNCVAQSS
jgi:hypothetical protein